MLPWACAQEPVGTVSQTYSSLLPPRIPTARDGPARHWAPWPEQQVLERLRCRRPAPTGRAPRPRASSPRTRSESWVSADTSKHSRQKRKRISITVLATEKGFCGRNRNWILVSETGFFFQKQGILLAGFCRYPRQHFILFFRIISEASWGSHWWPSAPNLLSLPTRLWHDVIHIPGLGHETARCPKSISCAHLTLPSP